MAETSIETEIDITKPNDVDSARSLPVDKAKPKIEELDDDLDLEIVDDTPLVDRNRAKPPKTSAVPSEDEIAKYSDNVQKRIRQMKLEFHEERRQKEAAMRENGVAIDMAKRIRDENAQLRKMVEDGHKTMIGSSRTANDSEMAALKESLKAAHEAGESGKMADLQEKISKAAARSVALDYTPPLKFEEPAQQQQQPQQQRVQISNPMQGWMQDNPWFNAPGPTESRMTSYAFGVHDSLIREGIAPESPAYFKAINEEMRERFPEYYGDDNDAGTTKRSSPAQRRTVGSANRLAGGGQVDANRSKTKVTLTQSELAVAKRVGVSPEQYAKEKLKAMEQSND